MPKAKSGGGESVADARIDVAGVSHTFSWQQVVRRHGVPAHHQGKPLVVMDVLHEGSYDLPAQLEKFLLVVSSPDVLQIRYDSVVQSGPDCVHNGQTRLLVHPHVTLNMGSFNAGGL